MVKYSFTTVSINKNGLISYSSIKSVKQKNVYLNNRLLNLFGLGIKLEMIYVTAGQFIMGASIKEERLSHYLKNEKMILFPVLRDLILQETPQHKVSLKPFYMSKFCITQEQYEFIMGNNPSRSKNEKKPVEQVSWFDATEFCKILSSKIGVTFSLPSESQWEYACRANTTTPFYCGETITPELAGAVHIVDIYETKMKFGQFNPNAFGLHDMHGSVWEWCADEWHNDYVEAPKNGDVWLKGDNKYSPVRGGPLYSIDKDAFFESHNNYIKKITKNKVLSTKPIISLALGYALLSLSNTIDPNDKSYCFPSFARSACRGKNERKNCSYDVGFRIVTNHDLDLYL